MSPRSVCRCCAETRLFASHRFSLPMCVFLCPILRSPLSPWFLFSYPYVFVCLCIGFRPASCLRCLVRSPSSFRTFVYGVPAFISLLAILREVSVAPSVLVFVKQLFRTKEVNTLRRRRFFTRTREHFAFPRSGITKSPLLEVRFEMRARSTQRKTARPDFRPAFADLRRSPRLLVLLSPVRVTSPCLCLVFLGLSLLRWSQP